MSTFNSICIYPNIFQVFGLSPNIRQHSKLKHKLPTIISYILNVLLAIIAGVLINWDTLQERSLAQVMSNFFLLYEILKYHILHGQCYFCGHIFVEIVRNLENVNQLFYAQNRSLSFETFRRSFCRKFALVMLLFVLNMTMFLINSHERGSEFMFIFKFWQLTTTLAFIHTVFYVDLLAWHLRHLAGIVQDNDVLLMNGRGIKVFKTVYHQLWTITQAVNVVFGWSIAVLLLQAFVNTIYTLYWLYAAIFEQRPMFTVLCKSNSECCRFLFD